MALIKNIAASCLAVVALAGTTSCSKENPFGASGGEGQFMKSALAVDLKVSDLQKEKKNSRSGVGTDDFTILFFKEGSSTFFKKYKYSEMPDVVTLPEGRYTCKAEFGENRNAEWESPYYLGESEQFDVKAYEITSYLDPIECRLENIKVTVNFDASLRSKMSEDSYVEVKIGDNDGLRYGTAEADAAKAGHFKHAGEQTLVATFVGTVDGARTVETKSLKNVTKGNHYNITFKLHTHDSDPTGDADADVDVDATVTIVDVERNVEIGDEPLLDDDERPTEDPDKPEITAVAPVDIDAVNDGNNLEECILNIHSYAPGGITSFTCDIESPTLTPEELQSVGLDSHLDLVSPGDLEEALAGLGFPVNVGGQKDVQFVLTSFMPMLAALGECEHHFVLSVTDEYGTTVKVLKIKY